ncbi:MAG TPA: efflux RND transporter periplasmic adaptor subunit [bacterium]|nr:efflux RND transporter periplasmic adaptor subunit [bacterium]HPG46085.1 efflux RND transporter periplasmic adaptor subunit [bacterium]HPM98288.1 efflux RND transporter periplasmic adaptor subunit [bacterium]
MNRYAIVLTLLFAGLSSCHRAQTPDRTEAITAVRTATVVHKRWNQPVQASGTLAAEAEVRLSFKIPGYIEAIDVREGMTVRSEQRLASLKSAEIDAQVRQAQIAFDKAQRDSSRMARLYADSAVTLELYQNSQTALEIARAQLDIALFNQKHAEIRAPMAGSVLRRLAEKDELVAAGQPILLFGSSDQKWTAQLRVAAREIVRLQIGDSASLVVDALPERKFSARVVEIAGSADPYSGTFRLKCTLHDGDGRFKSGFTVRATLYPAATELYPIVPFNALVDADGNNGFVFTVSDSNTAVKVPIEIAFIRDGWIALGHCPPNLQQVVTEGSAYLVDGTPVEIAAPPKGAQP